MGSAARENYLAAEVRTAPPQKLHLLLVEAAIRYAQRARQRWQVGDHELALQDLIHAQKVVSEILAGMDHQLDWEPLRKMAAVYQFIHRCLVEAARQRSDERLADALRVLEVERGTWREVCERLSRDSTSDPPTHAVVDYDAATLPGGFSLEA